MIFEGQVEVEKYNGKYREQIGKLFYSGMRQP